MVSLVQFIKLILFHQSMKNSTSCCNFIFFFFWLQAFKKLGVSVEKLSKVVSEEVPGTLSSLKLSVLEINELTRQLTNLRYFISIFSSNATCNCILTVNLCVFLFSRQKISGTSFADKSRSNKRTFTTSISND